MADSPGIALIKANEGCRLLAYDDFQPNVTITSRSQVKGTLTIGFGHTGSEVSPGLVWSQAQANAALLNDVAPVASMLNNPAVIQVNLNSNQHGALLSFVYNIGMEAFMRSSMLRHINAGAFAEVTHDFYQWTYSKGVRMRGLLRRRMKEATLWNTPVADDQVASAE